MPADSHTNADAQAAAQALLDKHVARSTAQASLLVRESVALYAAAHAPLVASLPPASLSWVYKILALEKETERLLLNVPGEDGFLINTDPKWSTHPVGPRDSWRGHAAVKDLYVLGLVHARDVASIRDLRGRHLPLLRAMRDGALQTIQQTYGLAPHQARA